MNQLQSDCFMVVCVIKTAVANMYISFIDTEHLAGHIVTAPRIGRENFAINLCKRKAVFIINTAMMT